MTVVDLISDPAVCWTARTFVALVFVRALYGKLRAPREFSDAVRGYALLPDAVAPAAAVLLLALECGLAVGLVVPGWASAAALGAAGLLAVYTAAIAINLARGRRDVDCGCAGPGGGQPLHEWLLARNALYIAACVVASQPLVTRPLHWIDGLTVAFALTALVALVAAAEGLAALVPRSAALRGGRRQTQVRA